MRFRVKLVDIGSIQHFTRVMGTISKLAKTCILRITSNKLFFILSDSVSTGGISIWCEVEQAHFFHEFNMDGVSPDANEIFLELAAENMVRSLKTAHCAKSLKIKLTKKHTPCLTLEVELPSLTSHSRIAIHDIPVSVIPRRLWCEYEEPEMPDFDVSVYMPPLKMVRNITERMKNLSNFVVLSANRTGELRFKVETDLACVTTYFKDLEIPVWSKEKTSQTSQSQDHDSTEFFDVRVDIRKLSQFLSGQLVNPTRVICNIVDNQVIHFFILHEDLSLQYFMPAVAN